MSDRISPYALLKASKPKRAQTQPSAYDLYSSAAADYAPANQAPPPPAAPPETNAAYHPAAQHVSMQPEKKTHYIADIHARHSTAMRRAGQSFRPL